jgi:hypothetical protein
MFGVDSVAGKSGINVLCAYDNEWREDKAEGCNKWRETTSGLSKKDRIDLANKLRGEETTERRHQELLKDSGVNRRTQFLLLILGALLGIFCTLISQYIWSLWSK